MCSLSVRVIVGYDWFFVLYLYLVHTILNMFPVAFLAYYQFYSEIHVIQLLAVESVS